MATRAKSVPGHPEVDAYIESLAGDAKRLSSELRRVIRAEAPGAEESFKWSRVSFGSGMPFCSFVACKAHISLTFPLGTELDDPEGLLEGAGKSMRHVKIGLGARKVAPGVRGLVRQAARLGAC